MQGSELSEIRVVKPHETEYSILQSQLQTALRWPCCPAGSAPYELRHSLPLHPGRDLTNQSLQTAALCELALSICMAGVIRIVFFRNWNAFMLVLVLIEEKDTLRDNRELVLGKAAKEGAKRVYKE